MARGRLVSRTLGSSRKFAALALEAGKLGEFAQALFPMLISGSDDFGRMSGDAFTVKHAVFPSSHRREADFQAAINIMANVGLIRLYEAGSTQVIEIVDFKTHQPGLSKRTQSKFPEPPVNFTGTPGISNAIELNRTEQKGTEQNLTARVALEGGFAEFWSAYPNKKAKGEAEKAWKAMAPDLAVVLPALGAQRRSEQWMKDGGRFIPYPATWLRGRRWEDLLAPAVPVRALGPVYSNWSDECQELHGGTCTKQWDHGMKMRGQAS